MLHIDYAHAYLWVKSLHLISMVAWMAGMLYLPRLYVYHTQVAVGSEGDKLFQTMERRLLRFIINPAMILTFIFGGLLIKIVGYTNLGTWFHVKIALVLMMAACHGGLARWRKQFARGKNTHTTRFYKIINEVPTALMIAIIILAVVKPW